MTTATIEDTEIAMLWGDPRLFCVRVREYGERTGAKYGIVIPIKPLDE